MSKIDMWSNFSAVIEDRVFTDGIAKGFFYFIVGENPERTEEAMGIVRKGRPTLGKMITEEMGIKCGEAAIL
jgi:hypothetical protein